MDSSYAIQCGQGTKEMPSNVGCARSHQQQQLAAVLKKSEPVYKFAVIISGYQAMVEYGPLGLELKDGGGGGSGDASSLCYCIHNAIDSDEEMKLAEERYYQTMGDGMQPQQLQLHDSSNNNQMSRSNLALPTFVIQSVDSPTSDVNQPPSIHPKHAKKKHKKKRRSHSVSSTAIETNQVGKGSDIPLPLIIQEPPTPTTPTDHPVVESLNAQDEGPRSLPLLNLPQIFLPGDDVDDDISDSSSLAKDNNVAHHKPLEASLSCSDAQGSDDRGRQRKRRRRSLVNLLFPPKNQAAEVTTPTLEAPQGQRLHFRRVSEIFNRMSLYSKEEECSTPTSTHPDEPADSPTTPAEKCGLNLTSLFPYRRRRSSVHHLDNTDQFKESREAYIQSTRRRMSSFPPMDGDEAAIMLEKANVIRLEQAHQEALALQNSNAVMNAFRKLRRGSSRSPSPMSLFPGMNKAKKSKWKSSVDINNPNSSNNSSTTFKRQDSLLSQQQPPATPIDLPPSTPITDQDEPRRPVFVFPKRKVEDVPGIFIPGQSRLNQRRPSKTKTTEDAAELGRSSTNLLAVMKDKPRRHSMSDPVFLQEYLSKSQQRPLLLPRSPYSTDAGCLGRYIHM